MATLLLDLPQELLSQILETLPSADLFALTLVCKRMHALAEDLLYTKFKWTWTFTVPPKPPNEEASDSSHPPALTRFVQTCFEKPHLADLVTEVVLEGDSLTHISHHYRGELPTLPTPEVALQNLTLAAVDAMDMPQGDKDLWLEGLVQGKVDAWVALLLSRVPKLQRLSLDENFVRDSHFVGMLLRWALCGSGAPRLFQSVLSVDLKLALDLRNRMTSRNTSDMLSLFYMPAVQHISASIDNPRTAFSWPADRPPNPTKLQSLELTMLREGHLGRILATTKGLTRFKWSWFHCSRIRGEQFATDVIDLDDIAADLSHVRKTLTDLTITAEASIGSGDVDYPPVRIQGSFEPLVDFAALKRLEVPLPFLTGSMSPDGAREIGRSLARNLEELVVTDDLYLHEEYGWGEEHFPEVIRAWLKDWQAFTPRVRTFHLFLKLMDYDDWGPVERQRLRDLGERVGVRVKITKLAGEM